MYEPRRLLLISKANGYISKLRTKHTLYNGKESTHALAYLIDIMIYGLSTIKMEDWQPFAQSFRDAKYLMRMHSNDELIKQNNYLKAVDSLLVTLDKYIEYLQNDKDTVSATANLVGDA